MIDYKLKADVISLNLHKQISAIDRADYLLATEGIIPSFNTDERYTNLVFQHGFKKIKEARKINVAAYRRIDRLKKRILDYLSNEHSVFLTLTFSDEVLESTNEQTRRKYVARFLKSLSKQYVANIDYGVDDKYTKREHYHAVVVGNIHKSDLKWWHDNCGFTFIESIRLRNRTETKLAKYVSKLTNHAIKISTKRCCYIYSRSKSAKQ